MIAFILAHRHWFIGGAVALALLFGAWRYQVWLKTRDQTNYLAGYNAATDKCEIDKAAAIVKGKTSRDRIDREIQNMPDADVIKFLGDNGFLRSG